MPLAAQMPKMYVYLKFTMFNTNNFAYQKFFDVDIEFNAEYLKVVFQWVVDNPLWATFGVLAIAFPCFCLCWCCYRKYV